MEAQAPSSQTTLLILLGASAWPFSPEFQGSKAFANAAQRLKAYFLNIWPFGLPAGNLLDLFDSEKSADELDVAIGQFLEQRLVTMKAEGNAGRDLVLYFIGHGGFVGRDSDFYLAIRRTRMENPRTSGISMLSLADTLTEKARHLRRIIILDCCFAAAAFSAFQTGPAQVAIEKAVDAFGVRKRRVGFPAKGTALLCSSSQKSPSLLFPDDSSTMFTKALLDALSEGLPFQRERLSLREVKDLAASFLSEIRNAPRPVVLSPDQSEGDVADIPFFPNPRAEEEQVRQAQEEESDQKAAHLPSKPNRRAFLIGVGAVGLAVASSAALLAYEHLGSPPLFTSTLDPTQIAIQQAIMHYEKNAALGIMYGFDSNHTRANPYETILSISNVASLALAWASPTQGPILSSPTVIGGKVYIGSYDHKLYAFDAATGTLKWVAPTGGSITSPAVANGTVYVGAEDGKLYAFDAATGTPKWVAPTGANIYSSPTVAKGMVYISSAFINAGGPADKSLYAFDAATGTPKWTAPAGAKISESSPAVVNRLVYVCSWDGSVHAFDAASGTQKWVSSPTGDIIISSPAVANGMVYVGSGDGYLYAFDAASGSPKWNSPTGGTIKSSPTVANGIVYTKSSEGKLYAFDAAFGVRLGIFTTGGIDKFVTGVVLFFSSPTVANGLVYVGSTDHKLYAFHLP